VNLYYSFVKFIISFNKASIEFVNEYNGFDKVIDDNDSDGYNDDDLDDESNNLDDYSNDLDYYPSDDKLSD